MSLGTGNQARCDISEMQVAQRYLAMLDEAGVTFFISGKCFEEEWADTRPICESERVEVAGHGYDCFSNELWHRIWNKALGSYNGPAWFQRRDARKTIDIIRAKSGQTIQSWRNHMYMHGPYTERVLRDCGIGICSDGVKKDSDGPIWHSEGIFNLPLNVMPDHEHLYHAERTPEWVANWTKRYNWSDDFGATSYYVEEWTDIVLDQLRTHAETGVLSNMIIHPITLYLCDKLKSFERILAFLESQETVHMRDVLAQAERSRTAPAATPT